MSKIQYTIRNIPEPVDQALRKRANRYGKSFNSVVLESLSLGALGSKYPKKQTSNIFDKLKGANTLDAGFDEAIKDQSKIDPKLWQ